MTQEVFGVATDGHRLAKSGSKNNDSIEEAIVQIVPRKGIIRMNKNKSKKKKKH